MWGRGILVTTAADANALPVAEFTLAMILLAGKDTFWISRDFAGENPIATERIGNFGRVLGIVGASRVGRRLMELLAPFDYEVLLFDPFVTSQDATRLGARKVDLEELMSASSIVSLHAPVLPETRRMVSSPLLARLPDGATLINTARGALIEQDALVAELRSGRLRAILDVTEPEPLPTDHELRRLPNVYLTPHLAGAQGNELKRLGAAALQEAERFRNGERFLHGVTIDQLERMA